MIVSSFQGQTALCGLPSRPPHASEKSKEELVPPTTLDNYIAPKCLRAAKPGSDTSTPSPEDPREKIPISAFGIEVLKVTSQGKFQPRRLALANDNRTILINTQRISSFKNIFKASNPLVTARRIDLSSIERIDTGQRTKKLYLSRRSKSSGKEETVNSLSIVFRMTPGASVPSIFGSTRDLSTSTLSSTRIDTDPISESLETVDFVVPSKRDYTALIKTLHDVMGLYRKYRSDTHRDLQLLQHHWIQAGLSLHERASSSVWAEIARDRLGTPFSKSKLMKMYKKYCKSAGISVDKGIRLSQAVGLLQILRGQALVETSHPTTKGKAKAKTIIAKAEEEPTLFLWEEIKSNFPSEQGDNEQFEVPEAPSLHQVLSNGSFEVEETASDESGENEGGGGAPVLLGGEESVTADQFLSFLQRTQGQRNATIVQVHDLFFRLNSQTKFSATSALRRPIAGSFVHNDSETVDSTAEARLEKVRGSDVPKNRVAKSTLLHFLLSDANDIFDPEAGAPGQMNMSHPLSSYWINTSHDTYLQRIFTDTGGDGIKAVAAMYGEALRRGCRCLELDLWDGIKKGSDPQIQFSYESTHSASLKDVLEEIRSFLIINPKSFPVILSFEDHCTVPFQERTANLLKEVLGGDNSYLYEPADVGSLGDPDDDDILPSPLTLRGKVIVKSKRPRRIRGGARVMTDDFDIENDVDPLQPPPKEEEDDIIFNGDDDIINPVLSMLSTDEGERDPDVMWETAEKDAVEAKRKAAHAEKIAFNLQVKAKRAEDHSNKLLGKLGWQPEDIEEKRKETEEVFDVERELVSPKSATVESVPSAEPEPEPEPEPVPVSAVPGPLERIRVTPAESLKEDASETNELEKNGGNVNENDVVQISSTLSELRGSIASPEGTYGDTFENNTFDKDELKTEGSKEGWLETLWNDVNLDPVGESVVGAPSTITSYTGGTQGDASSYVGTEATRDSGGSRKSKASPAEAEKVEEGLEVELLAVSEPEENIPPPSPARRVMSEEAGMEVQHFFAETVNQAKVRFAGADESAMVAGKDCDRAESKLRRSAKSLAHAEEVLYAAVQNERDLALAADRAAGEARSNHEHADIARQRVVTVRELLSKCEDQAATSETVAVTAVTEAKISEDRAREAEKRATRAQANAANDREQADEETRKEEQLEREMVELQRECSEAAEKVKEMKENVEKVTRARDKVEEQIKILEDNEQFRKEQQEMEHQEASFGEVYAPRALVTRYHEKKKEQRTLNEKLQKLTEKRDESEATRKNLEESYYNIRQRAQVQSKRASTARRQADQSTNIAEQLTEYAEEEREAAKMRKDACDKAEECVRKSEVHCASMEAQLAEAERAAQEAASLASNSRANAERLAKQAELAKNISKEQDLVERRKREKEEATMLLEAANAAKAEATDKAAEAKKHLDTAYEVFYQAKRVSTAEVHRMNAERQVERSAIEAFDTASELRKQADDAKAQAADALMEAADKVTAAKRARDFKNKKAKVQNISLDLARMALLHSDKFHYWEKSVALPASYMHSISEGKMIQFVKEGPTACDQWIEFNKNHLSRAYPSRHAHLRSSSPNLNPVIPWALGCQMVSMKFQACDDHMLLNDGRFRVNASSGYVLKPERLTDGKKGHDLTRSMAMNQDEPYNCNVKVLSGYNLPAPEERMGRTGPISPRVRVALYDGSPGDGSVPQVHISHTVKRNGLNPVWNEQKGATLYASIPSVAMLLITVWDSGHDGVARDDFIAAAAMPVSCLRQGYRSVPLFDAKHARFGAHSFSSLLVKVELEQLLT